MKRSEINKILRESLSFIRQIGFPLPPFAYWSPKDWESKGPEYDEIRDNMLGWDVTDFGMGEFRRIGLVCFTLRNGNLSLRKYTKSYAEKLLILNEGQASPFHFHWKKMEDIINRGGGSVLVQLYDATEKGELAQTPIRISKNGENRMGAAGTIIHLSPGESVTIPPMQYHKLWGKDSSGRTLLGEVSSVNDDQVDNRFLENIQRFPSIREDELPLHLLANEYPRAS